jgi:hypothetical protein
MKKITLRNNPAAIVFLAGIFLKYDQINSYPTYDQTNFYSTYNQTNFYPTYDQTRGERGNNFGGRILNFFAHRKKK